MPSGRVGKHYGPTSNNDGPSWLTTLGHIKDSLWSMDLFHCESIWLQSLWVIDVFTRREQGLVTRDAAPDEKERGVRVVIPQNI